MHSVPRLARQSCGTLPPPLGVKPEYRFRGQTIKSGEGSPFGRPEKEHIWSTSQMGGGRYIENYLISHWEMGDSDPCFPRLQIPGALGFGS